jgi:hypothetical protein
MATPELQDRDGSATFTAKTLAIGDDVLVP